jgi:hypothetical protein
MLRDARVYGVLFLIDQDFAAEARKAGCSCGGPLHAANYRRKPRCGMAQEELPGDFALRLSLCCDRDGCRRRSTPPSVRFLGRAVYVSVVVTLLAALAEGATPARLRRLRQIGGGVSRRTLERWRRWWRDVFPSTAHWREHRARFMPAVATERLPASLLERMPGSKARSRLVALLQLLASPTTSGRAS